MLDLKGAQELDALSGVSIIVTDETRNPSHENPARMVDEANPFRSSRVRGDVNGQASSPIGSTVSGTEDRGLKVVGGARDREEKDLILRHIEGDSVAFAELIELYRAPVYSYLTRCGVATDDRDDLFQDIFIRIHRAAASYDPRRPLHPWLFTIVANAVRNHLRRQRVRSLVGSSETIGEPAANNPGAERVTAGRQTIAWLEDRIKELPPARREVLLLACVENLPLREVAAVLALPLGTVKTHLRRARLTLAEELARRNAPEVES
jgi:RNA polymerase sigma-70 factor (ECF subfamily)